MDREHARAAHALRRLVSVADGRRARVVCVGQHVAYLVEPDKRGKGLYAGWVGTVPLTGK
jgi:hypothetical protein